jgi:hypothetical protein
MQKGNAAIIAGGIEAMAKRAVILCTGGHENNPVSVSLLDALRANTLLQRSRGRKFRTPGMLLWKCVRFPMENSVFPEAFPGNAGAPSEKSGRF